MNNLIQKALKSSCWAVAGATRNTNKFGNRIYKRLKSEGYRVYPLNPVYSDVEGDLCYDSPSAFPETPDCVSMVISPSKGLLLLDPLYASGVRLLWFQPGAYDDEIINAAQRKGFEVIYDHCVLVELNQR